MSTAKVAGVMCSPNTEMQTEDHIVIAVRTRAQNCANNAGIAREERVACIRVLLRAELYECTCCIFGIRIPKSHFR